MHTMDLLERAARIGQTLDDLFPAPPIPLDHADPFALLVAVMLSAQTTDKKVNEVTPALMAAAPTPREMATLSVAQIQRLIRTVGLAPTKAKHLRETAKLLQSRHGGAVPSTQEDLEALPGVGHKTAGVVMSQAFGIPAFPVDTHIFRLAQRWQLSDGRSVKQTEHDLKRCWPAEQWGLRHLQIIYFGRAYCPARQHDPHQCPICSWAAEAGQDGSKARRHTATPRRRTTGRTVAQSRARR